MQLFNKIFYKIWVPFTLSLIIGAGIFIIYYPNKLSSKFIETKEYEYKELTKTVALGVEIALNSEDFNGVKKTIEFISLKQDFDYCAVLIKEDSTNSSITKILTSYPDSINIDDVTEKNYEDYIYTTTEFKSKLFNGEIIIRASKSKINATISELISPVYYSLGVIIILSILIFYFFAKKLSSPIYKLIKITNELKKGVYDSRYSYKFEKDEIGELSENILELQEKLNIEQKINKELTENLENEVIERTNELQKTSLRLIRAQSISKLGHIDYSPQQNALAISDIVCEILGIDQVKNISLERFLKLINQKYHEQISSSFNLKSTKIENLNCDIIINRENDNEERWVSIIMEWAMNQDGLLQFSGSLQDITQRKQSEREIQQLSLVAKHTSNCVVITNKEKKILWVNDSLLELTGYKLEEIVGNSPRMFQCEKTNTDTIKIINETLDKKQTISGIEILNRGKYNNDYWLELNIVPIYDEFGELNGYIAVETNITDKKKNNEEQNLLLNLTQLQNERLQNFAYIVSHNLRSHTVNIRSLMEMLFIKKPELKEFQLTQILQGSIENLFETIDHLTDIAQIINNKHKSLEGINLYSTINKAISNVSSFEVNSEIRIINDVKKDITVLALPTYLDSIILNLITNAIKYRDVNKKSFIKITAEKNDYGIKMSVSDNGIGIDMERNRRKMFGMYKTFHRNADARGIGLFITKNQVEAMGGSIDVESEVNIGTTFTVNFKYEN